MTQVAEPWLGEQRPRSHYLGEAAAGRTAEAEWRVTSQHVSILELGGFSEFVVAGRPFLIEEPSNRKGEWPSLCLGVAG